MSIKHLDLFHGALLSKIIRNKKNKISLVEWNSDDRCIYKVDCDNNKELVVLVKYDATARTLKDNTLVWDFTQLTYKRDCYFIFVCIESKRINDSNNKMEICAIPPEKVKKLFQENEIKNDSKISCVVSLKSGESFRVKRQKKGVEFVVGRNEIDKL